LTPAPRPATEPISIRVDGDVLAWFRARGPRYQTHMVAVLRAYVARMRDPVAS
jgi:uncharacterized protein (DUF4415 family)